MAARLEQCVTKSSRMVPFARVASLAGIPTYLPRPCTAVVPAPRANSSLSRPKSAVTQSGGVIGPYAPTSVSSSSIAVGTSRFQMSGRRQVSFCEPGVGANPRGATASNSFERAIISHQMKSMYIGYLAAVMTRKPSQSRSRTRNSRRIVASKATRGRVYREVIARATPNR